MKNKLGEIKLIEAIKKQTKDRDLTFALLTLFDKMDMNEAGLKMFLKEYNNLLDSCEKNYISIDDAKQILKDEAGIEL